MTTKQKIDGWGVKLADNKILVFTAKERAIKAVEESCRDEKDKPTTIPVRIVDLSPESEEVVVDKELLRQLLSTFDEGTPMSEDWEAEVLTALRTLLDMLEAHERKD